MPFFFPFFFTNKNEKDAHIQYHCKTVLLVFKPATVQVSNPVASNLPNMSAYS